MPDYIVDFPLQNATPDQLGAALAYTFSEYNKSASEARNFEDFVHAAERSNIRDLIAEQMRDLLDVALEYNLFTKKGGAPFDGEPFIEPAVANNVEKSLRGAKLAAVVMLHNAVDMFFLRIVRIGLAGKRAAAIELVASRKTTVARVQELGLEGAVDEKIEEWWEEQERKPLPEKWELAVSMFGYPDNLTVNTWHFDKKMLEEFDELRRGVIRDSGEAVLKYDLAKFNSQLGRALMAWLIPVAKTLSIKMPAEMAVIPKLRPAPVT